MGSTMVGAFRSGRWAKHSESPESESVNLKGLLWRSCERAVSPRYYEKACNPGSCWKKWHRGTLDTTVPRGLSGAAVFSEPFERGPERKSRPGHQSAFQAPPMCASQSHITQWTQQTC